MSDYFEQKTSTAKLGRPLICPASFCPALKAKFFKSIWPPQSGQIRANKVVYKYIPKMKIVNANQPPWFDSETFNLCREKERLHANNL